MSPSHTRTSPGLAAIAVMLWCAAAAGCSTHRLATRAAGELARSSIATYRDEPDFEIARVSGYANVKLLEALLHDDPGSDALSLSLAEAFAGIAFAFAEDDLHAACGDPGHLEPVRRRVRQLYSRGLEYAEAAVRARRPEIARALHEGPYVLRQTLAAATRADLPALFWYAFNALGAASATGDSSAIRELGRVRIVAERLTEIDGSFAHGGPWLMLGVIDASLPERVSVTADLGASSFEQARRASDGRFLLADVEWARTYAVATDDRRGFGEALEHVTAAPDDVLPGERLMTTVAKRRAALLRACAATLFATPEVRNGE